MRLFITLFAISACVLVQSCSVEKKDIDYGNVHCYHCDMTVIDKSHSAEYVTKKGRAYFFDAVECMIMKLNDANNEYLMRYILVSDYEHPGNLIDAKVATYVICKKIKSPMGRNLSAFSSKASAIKLSSELEGAIFNWEEIKNELSNN